MDNVADNDAREETPPLGALLAEGREHHGLTRNDVAQRLHMSPSQVEALETGDYARLPKGTFLRGFVRNYAKLIGLEPESVLPLLAEGAPRDPAPRIVVPTQNIRFDPLGDRFTSPWMKAAASAFVVIALALAAMYWWLFVRTQPSAPQAAQEASTPAPSSLAAEPAPASGPASAAPAGASTSDVATPPPPVANVPAAATAQPAASAQQPPPTPSGPVASNVAAEKAAAATPAKASVASSSGERRLHFRFNGESWVEVRDASGRVVFRQLNSAGSEANVSARPPLQVIVGNAHEVDVERDGRPYDLEPVIDTDVARFKVE